MTPITTAARNEAADAITMDFVELHDDYTSDNVVSDRAAVTVNAASGGDRLTNADVDLTVTGGETARYIVMVDGDDPSVDYKYKTPIGADGYRPCSVVGDTFTCADHGFSDDQTVVVFGIEGGSVPTGLDEGDTVYYVDASDADTFILRDGPVATGAQVTGITDGKVRISKIQERTDPSDFVVRINAGTQFGIQE